MKIKWLIDSQHHPVLKDLRTGRRYNVPDELGVQWCLQDPPAAKPIDDAGEDLVLAELSRREAVEREAKKKRQEAEAAAKKEAEERRKTAAATAPEFGPIDDDEDQDDVEPGRSGEEV